MLVIALAGLPAARCPLLACELRYFSWVRLSCMAICLKRGIDSDFALAKTRAVVAGPHPHPCQISNEEMKMKIMPA